MATGIWAFLMAAAILLTAFFSFGKAPLQAAEAVESRVEFGTAESSLPESDSAETVQDQEEASQAESVQDQEEQSSDGVNISLSDASYGITASIVEHPQQQEMPMVKLLDLSEDELFSRWPTTIVRGTVTGITNVQLTGPDVSVVKAVITIAPSVVLRGEAGAELTVLANCPIDGTFQVEDTETVSAIRTGMEGIFMVLPYTDADMWELDGASLRWKDLASANFPDGRRYAFLDTGNGLLYAEWAYPGLAGASTLDEVEAFIRGKLGQ